MRFRSLTAVSALAATALVLAACSGTPEATETSDTPTSTPDASNTECLYNFTSGADSDAVIVDGEGDEAVVSVPEGTEFTEPQRTVLTTGEGRNVVAGDLVSVQFQIVDASTGETLDSTERGQDGVLPILLDPQETSLFVAALECQPVGSQVVLTIPASQLGPDANDMIVYTHAVDFMSTIATGTELEPVEGMPTVELDADGSPTITLPDTDAPTETKIAVLKEGDGPVVGEGDLAIVQYRGVKWSDGEEFDSSWGRGTPSQFPTSGVVTGFRLAIEGQPAGSQVLVVMPPEDGYAHIEGHELQEETLVFVVDILASSPLQ